MLDALTIFLIAVGLAMDAFAVSITNGITTQNNRRKYALLTAVSFGGFQMLMPTIGYFAGLSLESVITQVDHWVAFGLLAFIGSKMIYDAVKKDGDEKTQDNLKLHTLLTLSIATSIDALMVGLSFAFLQTSILWPVLIIGVVTFLLSLTGFFCGCHLGRLFGNKIKILGGLILIAIGLRILLEHLFF
jgi:putative Mn2+ efflux pump MntP